jgi:putative membrane protein
MTPHLNVSKTLLALVVSAGVSTLPAQNQRPDTQSGAESSARTEDTRKDKAKTSGDRTHAEEAATSTDTSSRSRTADASETMVSPGDLKFMQEAAQSGMMEIQTAKIAEQKAQSAEVKSYAAKLAEDHEKATEELKTLAKSKNVDLPSELSPKHQEKVSKLQNQSDDRFDREFMKMQVDNHKKNVKAFEKQSEKAMDSNVKEFASKTLPTLQAHLQEAQSLQTSTRARQAEPSATDSPARPDATTPSTFPGQQRDPLDRQRPGDPSDPSQRVPQRQQSPVPNPNP